MVNENASLSLQNVVSLLGALTVSLSASLELTAVICCTFVVYLPIAVGYLKATEKRRESLVGAVRGREEQGRREGECGDVIFVQP